MSRIFIFIWCIFFLSCNDFKSVKIEKLSGYWEIDFITQQKEKFNQNNNAPLYDYYQLNFPKGILKKVKPLLNGRYVSSRDAIYFEIEKINKKYYIRFKSRWDEWSRKISHLDSQKLILENGEREYHYKRPLTIIQ